MRNHRFITVSSVLTIAIAAAVIVASSANADGGKTRAQVKAELAEAVRTGDMPADDHSGLKLYEVYPDRYPARPVPVGKTRDQVKAELAEAIRTGDIPADDESGEKLYERYADRYPARPVLAGKTRDQVKAELAEARRLGDLQEGEDSRTAAERNPGRYAAARAQKAAEEQRLAVRSNAR